MILQLEKLGYRYGEGLPFILRGIDCGFDCGRVYAIVGESGSGKTTLLSMLARLDKPTEGRLLYNDEDVGMIDPDKYRAKCVSVIFQSYNLLYTSTAFENVETALWLSGYSGQYRERADELLDWVGIPAEKRGLPVHTLSGGEQQRVAIARSIGTDSAVILADEPTGNLDPENGENVMELLCGLAGQGKCVIIVTHSSEVSDRCNVVLRLRGGSLALEREN